MLDTKPLLIATDFPEIARKPLEILQVNLGYLCNLSCTHCHVNAGPRRTELMTKEIIDKILLVLDKLSVQTLDLTGGAPEMNPEFRYLVREARKRGVKVIDRCNLTILNEPGYEDLAEFLAEQEVQIVASMPCYSEKNVDSQRGKGVFEHSIEALIKLNKLGYGTEASDLELNLVYNPGGPFLPPSQSSLQQDYKEKLSADFGIEFDQLFTITNMPISRFGSQLISKGQFNDYMKLLKDNYDESNLETLMCKTTISVDWQGNLYDCDFNQMLEMPMQDNSQALHIDDLLENSFVGHSIVVAGHCYGCTAGQGSSCGGALDA